MRHHLRRRSLAGSLKIGNALYFYKDKTHSLNPYRYTKLDVCSMSMQGDDSNVLECLASVGKAAGFVIYVAIILGAKGGSATKASGTLFAVDVDGGIPFDATQSVIDLKRDLVNNNRHASKTNDGPSRTSPPLSLSADYFDPELKQFMKPIFSSSRPLYPKE